MWNCKHDSNQIPLPPNWLHSESLPRIIWCRLDIHRVSRLKLFKLNCSRILHSKKVIILPFWNQYRKMVSKFKRTILPRKVLLKSSIIVAQCFRRIWLVHIRESMPENVNLSSDEWFIFFYVHSERALYELPFHLPSRICQNQAWV